MATTEAPIEHLRPHQLALKEIAGRAQMDAIDPFAVAADVGDKIMMAETIDDILAVPESGPGSIEDIQGKMFRFLAQSLRWARSAERFREGGTGVYAFFRCVDSKKNEYAVTTGATNIVFQLRALEKKGVFDGAEGELFPYDFTVRSRETANGNLYWLSQA